VFEPSCAAGIPYRSGKRGALMKLRLWPLMSSAVLTALVVSGCRNNDRQDTIIASAANPSHTYRATVLLRQHFVDGKADTSPTTYVLLDKDSGKADYPNGVDFKDSQVVMKPTQCGPLGLEWGSDHQLKVICQNCGLALSAVGQHVDDLNSIQIKFENFPETSSWETPPGSH
jgi:hypothetical protein